jgi:hypothetical protein
MGASIYRLYLEELADCGFIHSVTRDLSAREFPAPTSVLRRYNSEKESKEMATFRKREDCPTSQQLLAYQLGDVEGGVGRVIGRHLAVCEFCNAEVDFYERYPQSPEEPEDAAENVSMPEPLFELAEALLNKGSGSRSMEKIISELEAPAERGR